MPLETFAQFANLSAMPALTRTKIGILISVLAPIVFIALALAGVRLITMSSKHYEDTGATKNTVRLHWPVFLPAGMFVAGIAFVVWPGIKPKANS